MELRGDRFHHGLAPEGCCILAIGAFPSPVTTVGEEAGSYVEAVEIGAPGDFWVLQRMQGEMEAIEEKWGSVYELEIDRAMPAEVARFRVVEHPLSKALLCCWVS